MIWIDYVFLVVVGLGLVYGLWTGLVVQLAHILGILGGVVFAGRLSHPVAGWLSGVSQSLKENPGVANGIAYVIMFLAIFVGVTLAGVLLRKLIKKLRFGIADRLLGGLVAAISGVILCAVLSLAIVIWSGDSGAEESIAARSALIPYFINGIDFGKVLLSEEKRERIRAVLEGIKSRAQAAGPPKADEPKTGKSAVETE